MAGITIRRAAPGDGPAFVRMHEELGETYSTLAPELFRRPVTTGLADEFEALVAQDDDRALHLVAEVDGEPAAVLAACLLPPEDDAAQQIQRDAASTRLRIEYLVTAAAYRRRGLATRLVDAAEAWGRENGATVAETWTYQRSPTSFPSGGGARDIPSGRSICVSRCSNRFRGWLARCVLVRPPAGPRRPGRRRIAPERLRSTRVRPAPSFPRPRRLPGYTIRRPCRSQLRRCPPCRTRRPEAR